MGQQADVAPALWEPLSWPGDGRGLDSVMVAEGMWRSPGPLQKGWDPRGPSSFFLQHTLPTAFLSSTFSRL